MVTQMGTIPWGGSGAGGLRTRSADAYIPWEL